ncbi:hypothetical protein [Amycolatopsis sp. lyj-346]|uniref:hypothetical protein n=1 Tax=Amycolatopsis sp. lyj-346 TaxID=2789289 RepID=UPI00397C1E2A
MTHRPARPVVHPVAHATHPTRVRQVDAGQFEEALVNFEVRAAHRPFPLPYPALASRAGALCYASGEGWPR